MRVKTGLSPALTLKAACVSKNAYFCYFKKNVRVKGLSYETNGHMYIFSNLAGVWSLSKCNCITFPSQSSIISPLGCYRRD